MRTHGSRCLVLGILLAAAACAQQAASEKAKGEPAALRSTYVLGPGDQILVHAVEAEEISDKPVRIGDDGFVRLALVGRIRAGGLTLAQFESELIGSLKQYLRQPEVSVTISEFRSQPVSVIGKVRNPGVHQLEGNKTLVEMLSLAGGLADDAGPVIKVTRQLEWGRLPLPGAADDPTGRFSVGEVNLKSILDADNPEQNILIRPHDVISVPRAELVYVVGQVMRSGGFVLNERESMSALQALSLAGGLDRAASPRNARVLRTKAGAAGRVEIAVNLKKILDGSAPDVPLQADDILFIPDSTPKKAGLRALEAAIQAGTGLVIWRR
jgi:polysaccharide export outer membrane protein